MTDVRLALRHLARSPSYSLVAVLTLALGIGATTAIYSVVNGVLLRPLAYREPERLIALWESHPSFPNMSVSYLDYLDWAARTQSLSDLGCFRNHDFNLTGPEQSGRAERLRGIQMSATLLPTLGLSPAMGRGFRADEDREGGAPVAMIGWRLWQDRFGGDPQVLGRTMNLDGTLFTIVGVLPRELPLAPKAEVASPVGRINGSQRMRGNHPGIQGIGRLKPGLTAASAKADLEAIGWQINLENGRPDTPILPAVAPLHENLVRDVRGKLWLLMGAVAFVLLVAVANVASLALARGASRRKEMAVRAALGAGRVRLLRQVLMESSVVALVGGGLGVLLALWGVDVLRTLRPEAFPSEATIDIDVGVLAFSLAVSIGAGLVFGIVPALHAARSVDLADSLKEDSRATAGAARTRARSALVVAEVALALVLLAGAGLSIRGFIHLTRLDPGFRTDKLVTMTFQIPRVHQNDDPAALRAYVERLQARVQAIPGIEGATLSGGLPILGGSETGYGVVGEPPLPPGTAHMAVYYATDEAYLKTIGLRLLKGRWLKDSDGRVAVIDEMMARTLLPGQDPIGQRVRLGDDYDLEVVGVVRHVVHYGPGRPEAATSQLYFNWRQSHPRYLFPTVSYMQATLRSGLPKETLTAAVRRELQAVDSGIPVFDETTMEEALAKSLGDSRFAMLLLLCFAATALVLAVVGLYSVMSYLVTQRTHEIGVRIALGARPGQVERMVVAHGARLVALGLAIGLTGALLLKRIVAAALGGVEPGDPAMLAAVAVLLSAAALAASWLPARRAARVDPMVALRAE